MWSSLVWSSLGRPMTHYTPTAFITLPIITTATREGEGREKREKGKKRKEREKQ